MREEVCYRIMPDPKSQQSMVYKSQLDDYLFLIVQNMQKIKKNSKQKQLFLFILHQINFSSEYCDIYAQRMASLAATNKRGRVATFLLYITKNNN